MIEDTPISQPDIGWTDGMQGVWLGLKSHLYHKSKAVSRSWMDYMNPPALLRVYLAKQHEETVWSFIGNFVHSAFLQPNEPLPKILKQPEEIVDPLDGKAYPYSGKGCSTLARERWKAAISAAGIMVLTPDDWDTVHGCVESLVCNRDVEMRELIRESFAKGQSEISCFKKFKVNGFVVLLRCRPDFTADGVDWLQDVKTLQDNDETSVSAFERVVDFYRRQPPFYLDVFNAVTGENRKEFRFFGVSKKPPYLARVFRLRADSNAIRIGRLDYLRRLGRYVECVQSGVFPGHAAQIVDVDLPAWSVKKFDESGE